MKLYLPGQEDQIEKDRAEEEARLIAEQEAREEAELQARIAEQEAYEAALVKRDGIRTAIVPPITVDGVQIAKGHAVRWSNRDGLQEHMTFDTVADLKLPDRSHIIVSNNDIQLAFDMKRAGHTVHKVAGSSAPHGKGKAVDLALQYFSTPYWQPYDSRAVQSVGAC